MIKPKWKIVTKDRRSIFVNRRSKYNIKYLKDEVVQSPKNTFGVFCFNKRYQALNFQKLYPYKSINYCWKIIKVQPLCRGKKPSKIFRTKYLNESYEIYQKNGFGGFKNRLVPFPFVQLPIGAICYDKIKVLE